MYTLYYSPGACSMAVHVLLNEIAADFKLENVSIREGKNRTPEFLKMNPRGQVPTLVINGNPLTEGAAILTYLCETHKSPLLPVAGWERAKAQELLSYANSSLHPTYGRMFFLAKNNASDSELMKITMESIQKQWDDMEAKLANQPYLAGKECTIGDILVCVIANWSDAIKFGPNTKDFFKRITSRPAYQKALAAENVQYKAAA
jgi:glutathione S-transferase